MNYFSYVISSFTSSTSNQSKFPSFYRILLSGVFYVGSHILLQGASEMGLSTLPPALTDEMANDPTFMRALYHVLMNVHLVRGILVCPDTGREFPVTDGIANFMLEEDECEHVRM
jgi:multifunctional methyltransferase subunit TRM112